MGKRMGDVILALGALCICYCIAIGLIGHGTRFFLVWGALGAVLCLLGGYLQRGGKLRKLLPGWIFYPVLLLSAILLLAFVLVQGLILNRFGAAAPEGLDYLVVLGAQIKEDGPSTVLRYRLDETCRYLQANRNTRVVVSGGRGKDEPVSEAEGMAAYLEAKGIAAERILLEDRSANTHQNLTYSAALFDKERASVGIVTNNFHVFRAERLAAGAGYQKAYGIAAGSTLWMLPQNLLRESCGVLKDFLLGNMG